MQRTTLVFIVAAGLLFTAPHLRAQTQPSAGMASQAREPLPPATKLEAFKPAAGSLVTLGYDALGAIRGVSVDARELRDARGQVVRGLVVQVYQSEYREERSFVDADEIPELLRGIDALLAIQSNPTAFKSFEVRYTTRGELEITAYNTSDGNTRYAIEAGRGVKAQQLSWTILELQRFRSMVESASQRLQAP